MIIDQKSKIIAITIKMGDQIRDLQKGCCLSGKYQKLQQRLEKGSAQRLAAQNEYEKSIERRRDQANTGSI